MCLRPWKAFLKYYYILWVIGYPSASLAYLCSYFGPVITCVVTDPQILFICRWVLLELAGLGAWISSRMGWWLWRGPCVLCDDHVMLCTFVFWYSCILVLWSWDVFWDIRYGCMMGMSPNSDMLYAGCYTCLCVYIRVLYYILYLYRCRLYKLWGRLTIVCRVYKPQSPGTWRGALTRYTKLIWLQLCVSVWN